MATKFAYVVLLIGFFAACGGETPSGSGGAGGSGGSGGSGGTGGSGGSGGTGGSGGNVPEMITVSGIANEVTITGRMPLGGVTIGAYKESDTQPEATAMSDAQGMYSLVITTHGSAVDGYLLGKKSGYKDTYLYPPTPLAADTPNVPVLMVTPGNYDLAATLGGANQPAGTAFIGVQLYDANKQPVAGATITSTPAGTVRYNSNGVPSRNASSTASDGIAYIFGVAPGQVTISASKSGVNFHTHAVNARPDQVTTTIVQP